MMEPRTLFCCLLWVVVVVLVGVAQGETAADDDDQFLDCVALRDAFYYAIHDYVLPTLYGVRGSDGNGQQMAAVKQKIRVMTGVNVDSLHDIQRLACRVVGVKTIRELSEVLALDYSYVSEMYQVSISMIEGAPGGVNSYVHSWQVTVQLADFFRNSQYPEWPLGVSLVDTFYLTYGLIRQFGQDFLKPFRPWETVQVDSFLFPTALADATSIERFKDLSELSDASVHILTSIADKTTALSEVQYQEFLRSGNTYTKFLQVCERLGLLQLQEDVVVDDLDEDGSTDIEGIEQEHLPLQESL